jgi:hypothetical protein
VIEPVESGKPEAVAFLDVLGQPTLAIELI